MRLLIVGATGALGRAVVAKAVARRHDVTALVRDVATAELRANAALVYRHIVFRLLSPMVPDKVNQERVVRNSGSTGSLSVPRRSSEAGKGHGSE